MVDGVGPASYAMRDDEPDRTFEGELRVIPLRVSKEYKVPEQDSDPRGMEVVGADRKGAGIVRDLWVDRSEPHIRYLETELHDGGGTVLVPFVLTRIDAWRRQVKVQSIMSHQFAAIPRPKDPHSVTRLEEDKILGYVAGGKLYAEPSRLFPAL
jgi:photosynthetic reaction center H subunit